MRYLQNSGLGQLLIDHPVLMHDPIGSGATWRPTRMVNEGLLHADFTPAMLDGAVVAGGLPVPFLGGAVRPRTATVLPVQHSEEVPLQIPSLQLRLT